MQTPKKAKQYGLSNGEQLYLHDQGKIVALHNYLIQNFVLSRVLPRLGIDPTTVDAVLTEDLRSVLVRPLNNKVEEKGKNGEVLENKQ